MAQFADFSLPQPLLCALQDLRFREPTEIQGKAIPLCLSGKDLIACSQTGSGKTAAFTIPLVTKLAKEPKTMALILVPTRELAKQVAGVVQQLTSHMRNLGMCLLCGGADMQRQWRALQRRPRIVVATPGRLIDHLRRGSIGLHEAKFLVLDEGDRMLDMGFAPQLDAILKFLPKQRQTLLFSATLPKEVRVLAQRYLNQPTEITVGRDSQPVEKIRQSAIYIKNGKKNDVLLDQLNLRKGSVIIFARTQRRTDKLAHYLDDYGHSVSRIHGGRTQGQRNSALQGFRAGKFRILVATDIAARGIDVPHIAHVINYDLPMANEDYVHRIGRTARAGAGGEALSLLMPEDIRQWNQLARKYKISSPAQEIH